MCCCYSLLCTLLPPFHKCCRSPFHAIAPVLLFIKELVLPPSIPFCRLGVVESQ
jgi:hypothetical protein